MKRLILTTAIVLLTFATPVVAQQAGDNVNVLPVVPPEDANGDPIVDWQLKGDGYLQRQVEPTIAASTLNPDHLLAFFNDYRAVDEVQNDVGLGEGDVNSATLKLARLILPSAIGAALPKLELVPPMNAAEAWIGGTRSTDGGYTWSGFYLPGAPSSFYPYGTPPEFSQDAPIYGLEAATDPVLAPGPCGTFYLVFVAFTRGSESKIAVARYRDTNNLEDGDPFVYEGMTVIESGNNAEFGYFLDKPDIEVDPFRYSTAKGKPGSDPPPDQCAHRVYVTYSTFNGLTKEEKVQTKMNFASAEVTGDGLPVFTSIKINKTFNQNQGSAIAVDPRPGTVGGDIYVFWRHFFDPHAIIFAKSTDYGVKWSAPEIITTDPPLARFDQPTISVEAAENLFTPNVEPGDKFYNSLNPGYPETAFRTNGFPTATVAAHLPENIDPEDAAPGDWIATPYVAWQERVGLQALPAIVMMRSQNEGESWSGLGTNGQRQAVDVNWRYEPFDPYIVMPNSAPVPDWDDILDDDDYQHDRPAGGQVQPKLTAIGGQLMLTFYESRGRIANYGKEDEYLESDPALVNFTPYLSGFDRVMDFRGTLIDPASGMLENSAQISRYPIRAGAILSNGQDLSDVAPVNWPCFPDVGSADTICKRQVNTVNDPTSAAGSSPFIGDYPDTVPFTQFVPDGNGWRWAIKPTDVPNRGFHAIWTDNRHISPPTAILDENGNTIPLDLVPPDQDGNTTEVWDAFAYYGPPNGGAAAKPCVNPGSRNTDVLTSRVNTSVVLSAPTTFKQLDADRGFPFSISNKTGEFRRFKVTILEPEGENFATLSPIQIKNEDETVSWVDQDEKTVIVFPYSSAALTVFVPLPPGFEEGDDQTDVVGTIRVRVDLVESTTDPYLGTEVTDGDWDTSEEGLVGILAFNAYDGNSEIIRIDDTGEEFGPSIGDAFVINWELDNAFVINNYLDNAFVINETEQNAFVINNTVDNAFVINAFVINAFVINSGLAAKAGTEEEEPKIYGVTDVVWTMEPGSSNTAGSFLPLVNIDDAEQYIGDYAFQLIVDKPSSYGTSPECADYAASIYQQQVLSNVVQDPTEKNAFVINKAPKNAFVINNQEPNAFVINSTFALAPSEEPETTDPPTEASKAQSIDDGESRNEAPSDQVRVTLRAFQLVPEPAFKFEPNPAEGGWLPSVAVADIGCGGGVDENETDCFTIDGPNLIPKSSITEEDQPLVVDKCGTISFDPGTFVVTNPNLKEGTKDAVTREKVADGEEGPFQRHGFYLRKVDPVSEAVIWEEYLGEFTTNPIIPVGGEEDNDFTVSLSIPGWVEEGEYKLVFFADWPLKVSEYDETDNTLEFDIVVAGSGAQFEGLQEPLYEINETVPDTANGGSAVPLKWWYVDSNGTPVDSSGANPIVTFRGWFVDPGVDCSNASSRSGDPDIAFIKDEDPGSSGLRYLGPDWQFNWQTKYPGEDIDGNSIPEEGDPLPSSCFEITFTSKFTCDEQADGPFLVKLN